MEDGVEGVRELLLDPRRFGMAGAAVDMPLWVDRFEVFREDGKEDSEGRWLEVVIEPLVEGR